MTLKQTKPQQVLRLGKGSLNCVAWSPDRCRVALGGDDHTVYVFTPKGELHWRRKRHTNPIECLAWSPNGRFLASGADDGAIRLWSLDGAELGCITGHTGFITSIAWSPDSLRLASGSEDRTLRLWSAVDGSELRRLMGHNGTIWSVAWSPNGDYLASGSGDRHVCLWSATSGELLQTLIGHTHPVTHVAWSPDSMRLASSAKDRTVRIWSTPAGGLAHLAEYEDPIASLAWSPNGQTLALGSSRGAIHLWSAVATPAPIISGHTESISDLAWSPDGSELAAVTRDGVLALWKVANASAVVAAPPFNAIQWIARQAATVGRRPPPWVPHLPTTNAIGGPLGTLRPEPEGGQQAQGAPCIALAPDGLRLASGHTDGCLRCWDLLDGHLIWTSANPPTSRLAQDIAWSPDGSYLATGAEDGAVSLWSVGDSTELQRIPGHRGAVSCLVWSPDGSQLASASADHTLRLWSIDDGVTLRCRHCLTGHTEPVRSVAWSPDSRFVASGSEDGTIRLWSASDGTELSHLEGHRAPVYSIAWSPSGDRIASGSQDKTIRLWSTRGRLAPNMTAQHCLAGHQGAVLEVAWSPDGTRLASGSVDATLLIWDLAEENSRISDDSPLPLRCFTPQGYTWRLAWAKSGSFLVSSHAEDTIHLWDTRALLPNQPLRRTHATTHTFQPTDLSSLPAALITLHRLDIHPPLSLVYDLRTLLGGGSPASMATLAADPAYVTIQHLQALHWPSAARTGLLALLLRDLPDTDSWRTPAELPLSTLYTLLTTALSGDPIPPKAPPPPIGFLCRAIASIDAHTLTLIEAIGADAVASDPSLLPRLISMGRTGAGELSAMNPSQRRLLHYPLTPLPIHQGKRPISLHHSPPRLRPTVLVVDGSPACHGATLDLLRVSAYAIATRLRREHFCVALVCAGGRPTIHPLEHPADLLTILTLRRSDPADVVATLTSAATLQRQLRDNHATPAPIILLLTHHQWGADDTETPPPTPHLRALFVEEGTLAHTAAPPWAKYCEHSLTLSRNQYALLPETLGRLIG